VPQHVRVHAERHLGGLAEPIDHSAEPSGTHGCPTLAHEHVAAKLLLALEATQGTEFGPPKRLDRRHAILEPRDVQAAMDEIDLFPAQRKATRTMVASRWPCRLSPAAFIIRSTSRSVRYSRVR
jgi:hypothetical protein